MIFKIYRNECQKHIGVRQRTFRFTGLATLALATVLTNFSSEPSYAQVVPSSSSAACNGKLGVHRTIKVSNKHTILVGVDNHGRIGLKPKELVLTFDDGPREGSTQKILKALADECVKATFFSLGRSARAAPHLLRRTAREGHTIGTHSQSHPLLTKRNNNGVRNEIRRGVNSINVALEGSNYKASNFFRYPFLDRSKRTDSIVREMGLIAFHMNIDSWDWRKQTPSEMVNLTMRRVRAEGSGIVLFHDIQDRTAAGLPQFLRTIKREGYKIVHIVPGESNFDFRQDLASRKIRSSVKPVKTALRSSVSNIENQPAIKKKKQTKISRRIHKAPHPKSKPRVRRLASIEESPVTADSAVLLKRQSNNGLPVPAPVFAEPLTKASSPSSPIATKPKKNKRFRLFRKIFGKKS